MPTVNEPYTTYDRGWILRVQRPQTEQPARTLLMLHGWTGDEMVMWIFSRAVPENTWIVAPRGPVQSPDGGYGWLPHGNALPTLDEFSQVAASLYQAIGHWMADLHAPSQPMDIMGFSQGAAMAYALAVNYPQSVNRIIALAGFLPGDVFMPGRYAALQGKQIYVAHGTQDETVPVHLAQEAVRTLQSIGAAVTYCESDVGHKLSASCLRGLDAFMRG